jgi:D-arabinose 1-dehydrogenase-like Zn-dependent alcohol dehydrogenase
MEQEPGPRGSPHDPQAAAAEAVIGRSENDLAGVLDCAANTDISFCRSALWQAGQLGDWPSRVRYSNRLAQPRHSYSKSGMGYSNARNLQSEICDLRFMSVLAAVMPAPRVAVELREFPDPVLEPGSILLRTLYSEVCGTDVHIWHGRLAGVPYPIIPGHVSVGIADKIRGEVRGVDGHLAAEGDRLAFFDVHRTCGRCRACTVTRTPTRCAARRVYGITDSAQEGLFGGWSEAIYLEPGVSIAKLPDSLPPETYISAGCGLITAVHAIDRAAIAMGDTVLVQGTGAVGLSAIALARLAGATRVIAFGAPADRLALAAAMGAGHVVDIQTTTAEERMQTVHDLTAGLGVDVAIEAAGSARAVEEALDLIRDGGRYVIAGHYTDAGASSINVHQQINRKHLEIRGCWGSEVGHFVRALRILEQHHAAIPWREIGARTYALSELNQALADAEAMRLPKALVRPH